MASRRAATPGAPRRWSGKRPTHRRNTATLAKSYLWSIAGPTITACQVPPRTSSRKTSRRAGKPKASRKPSTRAILVHKSSTPPERRSLSAASRDDIIIGFGRYHGRRRRMAVATNAERQALGFAAFGRNGRWRRRIPVADGEGRSLGVSCGRHVPVCAAHQCLPHANDGGRLDEAAPSEGAVAKHGGADPQPSRHALDAGCRATGTDRRGKDRPHCSGHFRLFFFCRAALGVAANGRVGVFSDGQSSLLFLLFCHRCARLA